ncbi:MAG: hypothetical protein K8J08_20770 [Thermoanaerobaculia bacterium]|nr:hypothetical protein [Thermoanaerobaculia bacterium]
MKNRSLIASVVMAALFVNPAVMIAADSRPEPPRDLTSLNQRLEGQRARLSLADGTVIKGARDVVVARDVTRFVRRGRLGEVETSTILRIDVRPLKFKKRRLAGAAIGIGAGFLLGGNSTSNDTGSLADGAAAAVGAVIGAGLGAVIGTLLARPRFKKLCDAPGELP